MSPQQRVLPADVYDALELSALVHGGIGATVRFLPDNGAPCCIVGHAQFLDGLNADSGMDGCDRYVAGEVGAALETAFGESLYQVALTNDERLYRVALTNEAVLGIREVIPWEEWCKRLNVVRDNS